MVASSTVVATLSEPPDPEGEELKALPPEVSWLEVRADLVGELDTDWLRQHFAGKLLYTLRSEAEGGGFEGSGASRARRLEAASERYDYVDLELDRDCQSPLLDAVGKERRVISWHGGPTSLHSLRQRLEEMAQVGGRLLKLVPAATKEGEEVAPVELLAELGRQDVVAFSSGPIGVWTRLLSLHLGAPVVYGSVGSTPAAPGQPSVSRLQRDFGLADLSAPSRYFGIVGNPVHHSLSPRLHNGAYRALGIDALYLPFEPSSFGDFWLEVVEGPAFARPLAPLQGLSVTTPFKAAALAVAGASSPQAGAIESANTLVCRADVWEAESTDQDGVLGPLAERSLEVAERRVAVIGCGGAGRAAAAGLLRSGADVTLVNRDRERGLAVAHRLGAHYQNVREFSPAGYEILVHATPLGRSPDDELPVDLELVSPSSVVIDLVYLEGGATRLVAAVRSRGGVAVDGREVLLHQARGQFRAMVGRELPMDLGRELLALEAPA